MPYPTEPNKVKAVNISAMGRAPLTDMQASTRHKRLARDLIGAWVNLNYLADKITFASLVDLWQQEHRETIRKEEAEISLLDDVYSEFMELGEDKFFTKYGRLSQTVKSSYEKIRDRRSKDNS
jgi:hypothetical protein